MQLRTEFVGLVEQGGNVRQLSRRFGISPTTAYKWLKRHRQGDELTDASRRPAHSPHRSKRGIEAAIVELRQAHPAWGARKLKRRLEVLGHTMPAVSTVHAILIRHGCVSPQASAAATPFQRFEHPKPNDLWQMDFKGHFAMRDGRCHPLTVLDDHSRYNLCLAACGNESLVIVRAHLTTAFRRYGVPARMTMDNGAPWGAAGTSAYSSMDVWLMKQGIGVSHSRPYHPQTQGKDERFHRTLKLELLQSRCFDDLEITQQAFDHWRDLYNQHRPHQALAMDVPAKHYCASVGEYSEHPPEPEYEDPHRVRRVQDGGYLAWQGHDYRIGSAFIGEPVAVRQISDERYLDVYWATRRIARLDLTDHTSISGKTLP